MSDKSIIGSLVNALSGTCRYCGCHGGECRLPAGDECSWIDEFRSLCNNPGCLIAADRAKKKAKRDRAMQVRTIQARGRRA